jgi:hypothetical protein
MEGYGAVSPDGRKELFFEVRQQLIAIDVEPDGAALRFGLPKTLFGFAQPTGQIGVPQRRGQASFGLGQVDRGFRGPSMKYLLDTRFLLVGGFRAVKAVQTRNQALQKSDS